MGGFESPRFVSLEKEKTPRRLPRGFWQRVKDSNPHIQSQSLLCYHYTNPLFRDRRSEHMLLYRKGRNCQ